MLDYRVKVILSLVYLVQSLPRLVPNDDGKCIGGWPLHNSEDCRDWAAQINYAYVQDVNISTNPSGCYCQTEQQNQICFWNKVDQGMISTNNSTKVLCYYAEIETDTNFRPLCPAGCKGCHNEHTCETCIDNANLLLVNGKCVFCHAICKTCEVVLTPPTACGGGSEKLVCKTCYPGFKLTSKGSCVLDELLHKVARALADDHTKAELILQEYTDPSCPGRCKQCKTNTHECESCNPGLYLDADAGTCKFNDE